MENLESPTPASAIAADPLVSDAQEAKNAFLRMLDNRKAMVALESKAESYGVLTAWAPMTTGVALGIITLMGGYKLAGTAVFGTRKTPETFGDALTNIVGASTFTMALNVAMVGYKVVQHLTENDFENWNLSQVSRTVFAGGLEFLKRSSPVLMASAVEQIGTVLLGGTIMSSFGVIIGVVIVQLVVTGPLNKWLHMKIKHILIDPDLFEPVIVDAIMTDEMRMQRLRRCLQETEGSTVWNGFLGCVDLFSNKDVATMALVAIPLNLRAFWRTPLFFSDEMIDSLINTALLQSFFVPAMLRQACRIISQDWVKRTAAVPCSAMWRQVPDKYKKLWKRYAENSMVLNVLCKVAAFVAQAKGLEIGRRLVTIENYRGVVHDAIVQHWGLPEVPQALVPPAQTVNLDNPSATMTQVSDERFAIQQNIIKLEWQKAMQIVVDSSSKEEIYHLPLGDLQRVAEIIKLEGDPYNLTYELVKIWRQKNLSFVQRLAVGSGAVRDTVKLEERINGLRTLLGNAESLQKEVQEAEMFMARELQIPFTTIQNSKNVLPTEVVRELAWLRRIYTEDGNTWSLTYSEIKRRLHVVQYGTKGTNTDDLYKLLNEKEFYVIAGSSENTESLFKSWASEYFTKVDGKSQFDVDKAIYDKSQLLLSDFRVLSERVTKMLTSPIAPFRSPVIRVNDLMSLQSDVPLTISPAVVQQGPGVLLRPDEAGVVDKSGISYSIAQQQAVMMNKPIADYTKQAVHEAAVVAGNAQDEFTYNFGFSHDTALTNEYMTAMLFGGLDSVNKFVGGLPVLGNDTPENTLLSAFRPDTMLEQARKNEHGMQHCLTAGRYTIATKSDGEKYVLDQDAGRPADPACLITPYLLTAFQGPILFYSNKIPYIGRKGVELGIGIIIGAALASLKKMKLLAGCPEELESIPPEGPARRKAILCHLNYLMTAFWCGLGRVLLPGGFDGINKIYCKHIVMLVDMRDVAAVAASNPQEIGAWVTQVASQLKAITTEDPTATGLESIRAYRTVKGISNIVGLTLLSIYTAPLSILPFIWGSASTSTVFHVITELREADVGYMQTITNYSAELMDSIKSQTLSNIRFF